MHAIFGDRFLGVREPAWHNLGTVIPEPVGAIEALTMAKLDYRVIKIPLFASLDIGPDPFGNKVEIKNRFATIIEPDENIHEADALGIVGPDYQVLQNEDLAELLEPLNGKWPIETAGAIQKGSVVWFLLKMSSDKVGDEVVDTYLLCSTGHDGKTGINIAMTRTRVVCWNTWSMALNNSQLNFEIDHRGDVKTKTGAYLDLIGVLDSSLERVNLQDNILAKTRVSDEQVASVINSAFPTPRTPRKLLQEFHRQAKVTSESMGKNSTKRYLDLTEQARKKYEVESEKALALRSATGEQYIKINDDFPGIANTSWAVFQAVTEIANWRNGPNADRSVMFGNRRDEMTKAYASSLRLIQA